MKALKTIMTSAAAILVTSSAALAQQPEGNVFTDRLETELNRVVGDIQTSMGLDFLGREGFYLLGAIAVALVLFVFIKVMNAAKDADELSKQRREVRARKRAEAEYEEAEARRQKRRYGS